MTRARRVIGSIATVICAAHAHAVVLACPVCFRIEDGPTVSGIRAAVFVLVGVTSSVLAGFGVFIVRFAKRAGQLDVPEAAGPR